ncbi:hypothetical protein N0V82_005533 [Gnomoniopsis sp. IMI 355080]|nr:hypothetical protein N0V82_005533 [Gnomoniopsis sp. IMI 355080]
MDISASMGLVENPSDPEELAASDSDSGVSNSSVETDFDTGLDITCDLIEKFNQGIGPWLFEVLTRATRHGEEEVASVHSYLIKREEIQVRNNKKKSLRKALKDEDRILNVMFELPKLFHPHGPVNPEYLQPLGSYFRADDIRTFGNTRDATEHPANRAWILLIRDIVVDVQYRRLGIGGNMIRRTIKDVLRNCVVAGRPLLVAVQPKRIDEFSLEEWAEISELVYKNRVNDVFWRNIGFKAIGGPFSGFAGPWYFWGSAFGLPPKKKVIVPDDLETRNTRTATPPPRPRLARDINRPDPHDWFPVVQGKKVRSLLGPESLGPSRLLQAPPKDDSAPGPEVQSLNRLIQGLPSFLKAPAKDDSALSNDVAYKVGWFDNPDDPSLTPAEAKFIRDSMRTLDALGKKYQVKPLGEPVQAPAAQFPSRQPKCPFKAPSGAKAPKMLDVSQTLPPLPPSPTTSQQAAALGGTITARRSLTKIECIRSEDDDDGSSLSELYFDELEHCSYEELVALGYINPEQESEDDDL